MEYNSKYTGRDIESILDSVNDKTVYTAGSGITITNGVISAEGGSSVDAYTKAESDAKYATKEGYYDKEYMDSKFKVISAGLNDLNEKVPTKTSQLTNDSGYLTEHQDISGLATKQEISRLATKSESDAKYATKADVPYKFVKLTQSAYDALNPKDVNTIYIIEG